MAALGPGSIIEALLPLMPRSVQFDPASIAALGRRRFLSSLPSSRRRYQTRTAVQRLVPAATSSADNMATPYRVQVSAKDSGLLDISQNEAAANKVTKLLQTDMEKHHVFFNASGFHNHIPHHLLTLYGTGATPEVLQAAYDHNASYQTKAQAPRPNVLEELRHDYAAAAPRYLGLGKYYGDFLRYFQGEIEHRGWQAVVTEHLFAEDNVHSRDLLGRLFAGLLHPLIQLMFGLEWAQPAIIAEGLAQAAVHKDNVIKFFERAERRAAEREASEPSSSSTSGTMPLLQLIQEVGRSRRNDGDHEKLARSPRWGDASQVQDGVFARALDEAVEVASRIRVRQEDLEERTAEMFHTAAHVAATTAWHPPHVPKFDFFIIHHLTSAPFFVTVNKQSWIPIAAKVRLLEWKMRLDLINYVARGSPPLHPEAIRGYRPIDEAASAAVRGPADLISRFHDVLDDGHTIKVVRALLIAQELARKYADRNWIAIKSDDEWTRVHLMLMDSAGGQDPRWIYNSGFEEAWESMPKAKAIVQSKW